MLPFQSIISTFQHLFTVSSTENHPMHMSPNLSQTQNVGCLTLTAAPDDEQTFSVLAEHYTAACHRISLLAQ